MAQPALKDDLLPAASHDDHEAHEDSHDVLGPDEPRTPGWLTATGGVLFMLAIVWFIVSRPASPTLDDTGSGTNVAQQD